MDELIALIPLISVFLIFYVILYIPQRRRQKKHKIYIDSISIGDQVITDSGIHGRVVNIKDDTVILVIKKGELEILKSNISFK
jgi:preprotein translocase subunit YajC